MVIGIGCDIVNLKRLNINDEKLVSRILTKNELAVFLNKKNDKHKCEYLAGRFAGKEAFFKAYGIEHQMVSFHDIEILNDSQTGRPEIVKFPGDNKLQAKISISHSGEYVVTEVILEKLTWQTKMKKFLIKQK